MAGALFSERAEDCGFPVFPLAGTTLPVPVFFVLRIYGKVIYMPLPALILGVSHIGIHLQHRRVVSLQRKMTQFDRKRPAQMASICM